jgi:hypothetical protein
MRKVLSYLFSCFKVFRISELVDIYGTIADHYCRKSIFSNFKWPKLILMPGKVNLYCKVAGNVCNSLYIPKRHFD